MQVLFFYNKNQLLQNGTVLKARIGEITCNLTIVSTGTSNSYTILKPDKPICVEEHVHYPGKLSTVFIIDKNKEIINCGIVKSVEKISQQKNKQAKL
jgi:hypothetical protein